MPKRKVDNKISFFRGQFVRVTSRDVRGRIKNVYMDYEDTEEGKDWLRIQHVPFKESELLEPWYTILIEHGGAMLQPQSRLENIPSFKNTVNIGPNRIETLYKNAWSIVRTKWILPWKIVNFWWKMTGEAQGDIEGRIGQRFLQEYDEDRFN
tara:strand:+ start:100 stop:555 length:456 start_codon:yes stop_codon:yes gene_type:complete